MLSQPDFEDALMQLLPALTQFARSLCRQSADAEDLVQETLVKALKNRDKYQPYGSLKSWLFTIMKNSFCSRIKRARRETPLLDETGPTISARRKWRSNCRTWAALTASSQQGIAMSLIW